MPPRPATVRVMQGGTTVTLARVVAGDPAHQTYSVHVRPGRYSVEASNWPKIQRAVTVTAGSSVAASFPNFCD